MKKKEIQQLVISFVCALLIYGGMMFAMSSGIINTYWSGILIVACINIVLATSLNLASGYLGQLTLGHAGFMSVGAYVSALCSIYMQVPFIVSLLIGALEKTNYGGITGQFEYDEQHNPTKDLVIKTIKDGAYTYLD